MIDSQDSGHVKYFWGMGRLHIPSYCETKVFSSLHRYVPASLEAYYTAPQNPSNSPARKYPLPPPPSTKADVKTLPWIEYGFIG